MQKPLIKKPRLNEPTEKQQEAGAKWYARKKATRAFFDLSHISEEILEHMGMTYTDIHNLRDKFLESSRALSKTFHVCPDCSVRLRGRTLRKDAKSRTSCTCDICGQRPVTTKEIEFYGQTHKTLVPNVRKIHHTLTLEESQNYVKEHYPEVFL